MEFCVDSEIFKLFPGIRFVCVIAKGIDSGKINKEAIEHMLHEGWSVAGKASVQYGNPQSHPNIKPVSYTHLFTPQQFGEKAVTIIDGSKRKVVRTNATEYSHILFEENINMGAHDTYWSSTCLLYTSRMGSSGADNLFHSPVVGFIQRFCQLKEAGQLTNGIPVFIFQHVRVRVILQEFAGISMMECHNECAHNLFLMRKAENTGIGRKVSAVTGVAVIVDKHAGIMEE